MKVKELIEELQKYPVDMEVVLLDGCGSYDPSIEVEKVTATVSPRYSEKDDFMKSYFSKDSDDYWSFRRVDVDVIALW
jgi:hypothetical protein